MYIYIYKLVVSTQLKNISQNWKLPQVGVKINNIWKHHLVYRGPICNLGFLWVKCLWVKVATNKKSHYIRVRGRCESGNTNQTWGHHFPLGDSATPSWTYYSNSIIYAGRGLRIIFATTHPVFHQKFFFLRGSSNKNQWYIIDTISRNRCFDQLGSACMMLGKGFKHILPYGGETWWFTMVQSLKKSPQKTNPSISNLPLDSFNTAASLDGNHVSLQLSIRLNKNSPTKQRDPYFMVYYNPHITG